MQEAERLHRKRLEVFRNFKDKVLLVKCQKMPGPIKPTGRGKSKQKHALQEQDPRCEREAQARTFLLTWHKNRPDRSMFLELTEFHCVIDAD
ncbi:unnamed protein product, partial [Amoebophrya sp. A25]